MNQKNMTRLSKLLNVKIAHQVESHRELVEKMRDYLSYDDELSSFSKKVMELKDNDEKISEFLDFEEDQDKEEVEEDEPTHRQIYEAIVEFLHETLKDEKGVKEFLKSVEKLKADCEGNCPCKKG